VCVCVLNLNHLWELVLVGIGPGEDNTPLNRPGKTQLTTIYKHTSHIMLLCIKASILIIGGWVVPIIVAGGIFTTIT
jgi:hypothetical protein